MYKISYITKTNILYDVFRIYLNGFFSFVCVCVWGGGGGGGGGFISEWASNQIR